jgi:hypothetical protein
MLPYPYSTYIIKLQRDLGATWKIRNTSKENFRGSVGFIVKTVID